MEWDEIPPAAGYPAAREMILKAVAIDEGLAAAHTTLAVVEEFFDWDIGGAEIEYRRAISLNPNSALTRRRYATYLTRSGRWREAIEEVRRAQLTDPRPGLINFRLGQIHYYARQYERALELCRETLALDPGLSDPYIICGHALVRLGRADETLDRLDRAYEERSYYMPALGTLPVFDGLRANPRFRSILKRIGVPARLRRPFPPA